jgi:hypothetical protein
MNDLALPAASPVAWERALSQQVPRKHTCPTRAVRSKSTRSRRTRTCARTRDDEPAVNGPATGRCSTGHGALRLLRRVGVRPDPAALGVRLMAEEDCSRVDRDLPLMRQPAYLARHDRPHTLA